MELLRDVPGRRLAASDTLCLRISSLPVQVKPSSVVGYAGYLFAGNCELSTQAGKMKEVIRTEPRCKNLIGHQTDKAGSLDDAKSLCVWHLSRFTLLNIAKVLT